MVDPTLHHHSIGPTFSLDSPLLETKVGFWYKTQDKKCPYRPKLGQTDRQRGSLDFYYPKNII